MALFQMRQRLICRAIAKAALADFGAAVIPYSCMSAAPGSAASIS
jgi:hypothetical protein